MNAVGNIAVVATALGVFGTGTAWPDIAVAVILAGLGVSGGLQIVWLVRTELRLSHLSRRTGGSMWCDCPLILGSDGARPF